VESLIVGLDPWRSLAGKKTVTQFMKRVLPDKSFDEQYVRHEKTYCSIHLHFTKTKPLEMPYV
jgi:hypothetical protein